MAPCDTCSWPAGCAATGKARRVDGYCHHEQVKASVDAHLSPRLDYRSAGDRLVDDLIRQAMLTARHPAVGIIQWVTC